MCMCDKKIRLGFLFKDSYIWIQLKSCQRGGHIFGSPLKDGRFDLAFDASYIFKINFPYTCTLIDLFYRTFGFFFLLTIGM